MSAANESSLLGLVIENRFEIVAMIGQGGMGSVYKARHKQIDLTVAVKVLKSNGKELDRERLLREARTINSLYHPNIINVFSCGFLETGEPYLVLDYIDGQELSWFIEKEGGLAERRALAIFKQMTDALDYAHSSGILHRDLKPHNVMLLPDEDKEEQAKLLDFGIAKLLNPSGQDIQQLTQAGMVFGSPLYMSPEQCQGQEVDARSDIYSFGCLMYETLSGKVPLEGPNAMATAVKHILEMPLPFAKICPDRNILPGLSEIVFRCLQKAPSDRYPDARQLKQDLLSLG